MSFINYSSREINCKIVYYGPGLCGKTTNLQYIYSKTNPELKGKMISLATETERTLFFDFLPLALGQIRGFKTRFHLYTVPGQVFYDASRKLILKGVDGVVFVADSQIERTEANLEKTGRHRQIHFLGRKSAFAADQQYPRRRVELELLPRAPPVALAPARQVPVDVRALEPKSGGEPGQDPDESRAVRLTCRREAQCHADKPRARRIASTGAGRPVQSSNEAAP